MDYLTIFRDGELPATEQVFQRANLRILRCSFWSISAWSHTNLSSPYWRLYWNRDEGAKVTWNKREYALAPNRLILIGPNTPFRSSLVGDTDVLDHTNILIGVPYSETDVAPQSVGHFFVHFTLGQPLDSIAPCVVDIPIGAESRALFGQLTEALAQDRHHFDHSTSYALNALILQALARVPEAAWPERQLDPRILRVLKYIEDNLTQPLHNDGFGEIAHMSTNAFTRLFKEKVGVTPMAHLNAQRIERASILLHHTDHSIETIAEQCGYSDRNYFTRVFTKHFGLGPASYRKHRAL